MDQWIVQVKKTSKDEWLAMHPSDNPEEDFDLEEDFLEVEVSVVKKHFTFGQESYGWEGLDKIVLPCEDECSEAVLKEWTRRAKIICDALNTAQHS